MCYPGEDYLTLLQAGNILYNCGKYSTNGVTFFLLIPSDSLSVGLQDNITYSLFIIQSPSYVHNSKDVEKDNRHCSKYYDFYLCRLQF